MSIKTAEEFITALHDLKLVESKNNAIGKNILKIWHSLKHDLKVVYKHYGHISDKADYFITYNGIEYKVPFSYTTSLTKDISDLFNNEIKTIEVKI